VSGRVALPTRLLVLAILPLVLGVGAALAASNVVPTSKAARRVQTITVNAVKPAACSSLTLTGVTTGSGTINDTAESNLVLGSAGADTIRGNNGNDCIVGGAGNDSLRGDNGTDVCIGGGGTDTFHTSCETRIQ
jgi:Ca2+-binding RTX toxin-like protein